MKCMISIQIPYSPPPQPGASDPLSGLTGLCVHLFYPDLFPSEINIISPPPPKKKHRDCPINSRQGVDRAAIDKNKKNNNKTSVLLVMN